MVGVICVGVHHRLPELVRGGTSEESAYNYISDDARWWAVFAAV